MTTESRSDAREVIERHERSMSPGRRRELGAHFTPAPLAALIVRLAFGAMDAPPLADSGGVVCDPSCGAGSLLLAAADALVAGGADPTEVFTQRLLGVEVDPDTADAARVALRCWADANGIAADVGSPIVVGDALSDPRTWADRRAERVAVVVGNPPFLSPLAADTAPDRSGPARGSVAGAAATAYTDAAAVHLLAAVDLVVPGGVVCFLQPQSVLGARDAAGIRAVIEQRGTLVGLWATDEHPFEAQVSVCATVLRKQRPKVDAKPGPVPDGDMSTLRPVAVRWRDGDATEVENPGADGAWAAVLAAALGVPVAPPVDPSARRLDEVANLTAGFRDEFYALAGAAVEAREGDGPRLVTSGMIDPGALHWGDRSFRLAGTTVCAPRLDREVLGSRSPRVAAWVARRLVPKVLVASQTRVIEAWTDTFGDCVPVTPVVSVEPTAEGISAEMVAAVLAAPSSSARLAAVAAGTGRSSTAVRVSAATLGRLPVPVDQGAWLVASAAWRAHGALEAADEHQWCELGRVLDGATGVESPEILEWWVPRMITAAERGGGRRKRV